MEVHKAGFTIPRFHKTLHTSKPQIELIKEVGGLLRNFEESLPCPEYCRMIGKLSKFEVNKEALVIGYEYSFVPWKFYKY